MGRHAPDPELVALALDQVRRGLRMVEVAETAGVSTATIARWIRRYGEPGLVPRTARPEALEEERARLAALEEAPPVADELDDGAPAIEIARQLIRDTRQRYADAVRAGDTRRASQYSSHLTAQLTKLAALERRSEDDDDVMRIRIADIEAAMGEHRRAVQAILARPLHCAECGRRLTAQIVELEADAARARAEQRSA